MLQSVLYEGVPVYSSREWIDFLMPGDNGDWIWGTQGQTNDAVHARVQSRWLEAVHRDREQLVPRHH
jgi:hypothetical protein